MKSWGTIKRPITMPAVSDNGVISLYSYNCANVLFVIIYHIGNIVNCIPDFCC